MNAEYEEQCRLRDLPELAPLGKAKRKITMIVLGGGMMGADAQQLAVTRGWLSPHGIPRLGYSEPRGRKIYVMEKILQHGAIILDGHCKDERPIFEGDVVVGGMRSMMLDGQGGRFVDADGDNGEKLIAWLKEKMLLHTLTGRKKIELLIPRETAHGRATPGDPYFKSNLLRELGDPAPVGELQPEPPERVELLTEAMKEKLQAQCGIEPRSPLFKIFMPEGVGTWMLFSMEPDGDTLWTAADIGQGVVEYGTMSLKELETTRGPTFGMPMERDIHFDGSRYTLADLLEKDNLSGV